jgi:hypothetical protein
MGVSSWSSGLRMLGHIRSSDGVADALGNIPVFK